MLVMPFPQSNKIFFPSYSIKKPGQFLLPLQYGDIVPSAVIIPDMENHGQLQLPRQIQLIDEPDMLLQPVLLLTLVVIVQTDFANGDHARRIRICSQFMPVRPLFKNGSGGVNTDCREDPSRVLCGQLQNFFAGLHTDSRLD